jgi:hypothetical protein
MEKPRTSTFQSTSPIYQQSILAAIANVEYLACLSKKINRLSFHPPLIIDKKVILA